MRQRATVTRMFTEYVLLSINEVNDDDTVVVVVDDDDGDHDDDSGADDNGR